MPLRPRAEAQNCSARVFSLTVSAKIMPYLHSRLSCCRVNVWAQINPRLIRTLHWRIRVPLPPLAFARACPRPSSSHPPFSFPSRVPTHAWEHDGPLPGPASVHRHRRNCLGRRIFGALGRGGAGAGPCWPLLLHVWGVCGQGRGGALPQALQPPPLALCGLHVLFDLLCLCVCDALCRPSPL